MYLSERNIYGSSRLGQEQTLEYMTGASYTYTGLLNNEVGDKRFELSNHLGNVLEVVADTKLGVDDGNGDVEYYTADVVSYSDYYPYGMLMPNRHGSTENYRYGFQNQEIDPEIKGEGNSINYKYRMHDPRIGRFFAVDPLAGDYSHNSPYAFSENKVIAWGELEGLEAYFAPTGEYLGSVGKDNYKSSYRSTSKR